MRSPTPHFIVVIIIDKMRVRDIRKRILVKLSDNEIAYGNAEKAAYEGTEWSHKKRADFMRGLGKLKAD